MTVLIAPRMRRWMQDRIAARPTVVPEGAPFAAVPGVDPDRVLLLGSGPAAGLGAATQEAALTGRLAAGLAARTGRGAVVESRARPDIGLADVQALLAGAHLSRYDGVVVFAGLVDAIGWEPVGRWRARLGALLDAVLSEAPADATVVLTTIPPASSVHAYSGVPGRLADLRVRALNRVIRRTARDRARIRLAELAPPDRTTPPAAQYSRWAESISDVVASVVVPAAARPADLERDRVAALARTDVVPMARDARFDEIAARARALFGADAAAVSFIGEDVQWFPSFDGHDTVAVPRSISICDATIASAAPVVIGDLHAAPAYDGNPLVHGDPPIRFYAGCPIESADGYRIGTVCVFGLEPRSAPEVDLGGLQELAAAARAVVWVD